MRVSGEARARGDWGSEDDAEKIDMVAAVAAVSVGWTIQVSAGWTIQAVRWQGLASMNGGLCNALERTGVEDRGSRYG
jgi:hypothetical protein